MKRDDCYQLGQVIKSHGLKGEVSIALDVDFPEEYQELESVFLLINEKLVPFFIEYIQINGNKAIVKFEDIDAIEDTANILKTSLFLPLDFLPELDEGKYYFHQLVGCEVFQMNKPLGIVKEVIDLSSNELLVVIVDQHEVLIPIQDEILKKVDVKNKRIDVELPDGLLELYLS